MGSKFKSSIRSATGKSGLFSVGSTFALLFVRYCLRKPGIQVYLDSLIDRLFHLQEDRLVLPAEVIRNSETLVRMFQERGFVPSRLAVDGLPGSGKSSLSAALAMKLGMDSVCLDHQDMDQPLDFTRCNAIYEHHRLLRTQDLEAFDAIIYIDEPVEASKKRVLNRKRGGYLVEILDYALLKRIGDKAFSCAESDSLIISGTCLRIKFRPVRGYRDNERIKHELCSLGLERDGLTKEESLFLLEEGVPRSGFKAYLNIHALDKEALAALSESVFLARR